MKGEAIELKGIDTAAKNLTGLYLKDAVFEDGGKACTDFIDTVCKQIKDKYEKKLNKNKKSATVQFLNALSELKTGISDCAKNPEKYVDHAEAHFIDDMKEIFYGFSGVLKKQSKKKILKNHTSLLANKASIDQIDSAYWKLRAWLSSYMHSINLTFISYRTEKKGFRRVEVEHWIH